MVKRRFAFCLLIVLLGFADALTLRQPSQSTSNWLGDVFWSAVKFFSKRASQGESTTTLSDELQKKTNLIRSLKNKLDERTTIIADLEKQTAKMSQDIGSLQRTIKGHESMLKQKESEVKTAEAAKFEKKIQNFMDKIAGHESKLKQKESEVEAAEAATNAEKVLNEDLQRRLDETNRSDSTELDAKIQILEDKLDAEKVLNEDLQRRLDETNRSDSTELDAKIESARIQELENKLDDKASIISNLKTKIAEHESMLKQKESEVKTAEAAKFEEMIQTLEDFIDKNADLETKIAEHESMLKQKESEVEAAKAATNAEKVLKERLQRRLDDTNRADLETKIQLLQAQLNEKAGIISNLETKIAAKKSAVHQIKEVNLTCGTTYNGVGDHCNKRVRDDILQNYTPSRTLSLRQPGSAFLPTPEFFIHGTRSEFKNFSVDSDGYLQSPRHNTLLWTAGLYSETQDFYWPAREARNTNRSGAVSSQNDKKGTIIVLRRTKECKFDSDHFGPELSGQAQVKKEKAVVVRAGNVNGTPYLDRILGAGHAATGHPDAFIFSSKMVQECGLKVERVYHTTDSRMNIDPVPKYQANFDIPKSVWGEKKLS